MLKLGRVTKVKVLFLVLVFVFNFDLFKFSAAILEKGLLCTYQRPSRGGDPGDIRGNSAGFADFCRQFLAQDRGIGPRLHYRGKIHGERPAGFVTSPPS